MARRELPALFFTKNIFLVFASTWSSSRSPGAYGAALRRSPMPTKCLRRGRGCRAITKTVKRRKTRNETACAVPIPQHHRPEALLRSKTQTRACGLQSANQGRQGLGCRDWRRYTCAAALSDRETWLRERRRTAARARTSSYAVTHRETTKVPSVLGAENAAMARRKKKKRGG